MMGGAGIDSVSSAQSRRAGIGVEHRGAGLGSGRMGGRGREAIAVGGSDTSAAVKDGEDGETARLRGVWGISGGWDMSGGSSGGSPGVFCCSSAVVGGAEQGRAGGNMVVDEYIIDDVAVRVVA